VTGSWALGVVGVVEVRFEGRPMFVEEKFNVYGCSMFVNPFTNSNLLNFIMHTLSETNIAPEALGLEDEFPFGKAFCQVRTSVGECTRILGKLTIRNNPFQTHHSYLDVPGS